jgi:hypothetical protein
MMQDSRLIAALVLVLAVNGALADEAEDRSAQAVEKLGGKVTRDTTRPGSPVVTVFLVTNKVTDESLKELAGHFGIYLVAPAARSKPRKSEARFRHTATATEAPHTTS